MALSMRTVSQASTSRAARPSLRRAVACQASKQEAAKQVSTAVAAAALATVVSFGNVDAAYADIAGLTPCSESKAFAKLQKNELKTLQKRMKKYEAGSAPALALKATMERTENRFKNYAKAGLLCGADGLPHLISDPGLAFKFGHTGEVFIPTIGFLYVAGYIGHVGRTYLNTVRETADSKQKEIIIDMPMALRMAFQGAAWPIEVIKELKAGTLTEKEENITVSPR